MNERFNKRFNAPEQPPPIPGRTQSAPIGPPISQLFPQASPFPRSAPIPIMQDNLANMSDEEEVSLQYIIDEKPSTKIVRQFFKENLEDCKSQLTSMFDS